MTLPPGRFTPVASGAPTSPRPAGSTEADAQDASGPLVRGRATRAAHTITGKDLHKMGIVELPKDKRYSLAVLQGAATGQIFPITQGPHDHRALGADVNIDDPEASRTARGRGDPRRDTPSLGTSAPPTAPSWTSTGSSTTS